MAPRFSNEVQKYVPLSPASGPVRFQVWFAPAIVSLAGLPVTLRMPTSAPLPVLVFVERSELRAAVCAA